MAGRASQFTVGTAAALVIPFIYFFLKEKPEALGMTPYGAPADWQPPAPSELSAGRMAIDTISRFHRSQKISGFSLEHSWSADFPPMG